MTFWRMRRRSDRPAGRQRVNQLAGLVVALLTVAPLPAGAAELSAAQAALYSTVSIYPPSASAMTVCYGFVCRRREMLNFTPGDRSALTRILASGHSSAAAERTATQR